ncbi:MAG: OmpA family protein [Crocinitomicaceae bacterium]|nr:OmpA family protein [Crocinitomicaceae bacterium]
MKKTQTARIIKSFPFNHLNKLILVLLYCFLTLAKAHGQKHALNWYFGQNSGLNFESFPPRVLTDGAIIQREGNATISDENGSLLFYTDGSKIWNKDHEVMKNGDGLKGQWIAAQSAIIAKQPSSESIYYVFTVSDWQNDQGELSYSIVDMSKDNGLGEVSKKNILINKNVREQISAVYADEALNVWILAHEKDSKKFVAYKLSANGLNSMPIVSEIGMMYTGKNRYGQLKFSADGTKVCSTLGGDKGTTVQLFQFNQKSGKLTTEITISANGILDAYSSEFSPNGQVLYVTSFNGTHLYQYDLSSGIESVIQASKIDLSTTTDKKSCLQIGYDHKIYVSKDKQNNIGIIHKPNVVGSACMFETDAIKLPEGSYCRLGFPNFIQSYFKFYKNMNNLTNDQLIQEGHLESVTFNIYFESGSAKLTEKAMETLDEITRILTQHPEYKAIVSSHTDCQGNADSNLKLSQKRAKSSANYLNKNLNNKINEGIGYGETKPVNNCECSDCSDDQNAENRRTEIKLVPTK